MKRGCDDRCDERSVKKITLKECHLSKKELVFAPSGDKSTVYGPETSMYLLAFEQVLDTVLKYEDHLFSKNEIECIQRFFSFSAASRYLFVRLFMRKRDKWFRVSQLNYKECQNLNEALNHLVKEQFLDDELALTLEDALTNLQIQELKVLAKQHRVSGSTRKELETGLLQCEKNQSLISNSGQLLLNLDRRGRFCSTTSFLLEKTLYITGPCVRINPTTAKLFHLVNSVYFRSSLYNESSLTSFVLERIQTVVYPKYTLSRTRCIFPSRLVLDSYVQALELSKHALALFENYGKLDDHGKAEALSLFFDIYPKWLSTIQSDVNDYWQNKELGNLCETSYYATTFSPGSVLTYLIHKGTIVLARTGLVETELEVLDALLAQNVHQVGKRGAWYERKALIEHNQRHISANEIKIWRKRALVTCIHGLEDKYTRTKYKYSLSKRLRSLERSLKIPKREQYVHVFVLSSPLTHTYITGKLVCDSTSNRTTWCLKDDGLGTVEEKALEYYESLGWKGLHSESGIITTLFALLFWDILFCDVKGVFQSPFQNAPLDLYTESFYNSRETRIINRLQEISCGKSSEILEHIDELERKTKTRCVGLNWAYEKQDLITIAKAIGNDGLACLCKLLAEDYGNWSSGLPDLCLWREKPELAFCLVEVKSLNDRLSESQKVWLDVLQSNGISVSVCHVHDVDGNDTRRKLK